MEALIKKRIKQVIKGDQNAFGEIVEIYKDKVFQIAFRMLGNRHEAEDIAQEAFIRAYINIESFNINLKFSTWLYRIATNLCIDRIRKKKPDYYLDAEVAGTEGLTMYSQIPSKTAFTRRRCGKLRTSGFDTTRNLEASRKIPFSYCIKIYRGIVTK